MYDQVPKWLADLAPPAGQRWSLEASRAGLARARELHRQSATRSTASGPCATRWSVSTPSTGLARSPARRLPLSATCGTIRFGLKPSRTVSAHEAEELRRARLWPRDRTIMSSSRFGATSSTRASNAERCTARRIVSALNPALVLNAGTAVAQRWLEGGPAPGDVSGIRAQAGHRLRGLAMSDHIKSVGPHTHRWRTVAVSDLVHLQECQLCRTRRATDGTADRKPVITASVPP